MPRFRFLKLLQWTIVSAIFIFLGKMVWEQWAQLQESSFTFEPVSLILSTLIFAFSYFIHVWAWYLITLKLGIAIPFRETMESWFYSQLGKYLPGKIWLVLGRFHLYESKGKSKKGIWLALYFELVIVIVAGGLIFLASIASFERARPYFGETTGWLLFPFLLAMAFLHPRVLQEVINWILRRFKQEAIFLSISYPDVLWILSVCILSWLAGGIGFYLFIQSVFPVSSDQILFLTGALAFSNTLGMIALFAPSGLGVREGSLVYILSGVMPGPVAVIISVLTRIWMTLIEIGLIGVIYLAGYARKALVGR
jgi:glycosyltransferase 2 family protein